MKIQGWPIRNPLEKRIVAARNIHICIYVYIERKYMDDQLKTRWMKGRASSVLSAIVAVKEIKKDNSALCRHLIFPTTYTSVFKTISLEVFCTKLHIIHSFTKGLRCRGMMRWSLESSRKPKHPSKPIEPFPFSQRSYIFCEIIFRHDIQYFLLSSHPFHLDRN